MTVLRFGPVLVLLAACDGPPVTLCPLTTGLPVHAKGPTLGEVVATLEPGTKVTGREPGILGPEEAWKVEIGEVHGYVPQDAMLSCPLEAREAWVLADSAVKRVEPRGEAVFRARPEEPPQGWAFGTTLHVAQVPGVEGRLAVVEDGAPVAWVDADALTDVAPTVDLVQTRVVEALAVHDLDRARALMAGGKRLPGVSAELRRLDQAVYRMEVGAILPPFETPLTPRSPVGAPGLAWVVVPELQAGPDAPRLVFGSAAYVLEVSGDEAVIGPPETIGSTLVLELGAWDQGGPERVVQAAALAGAEPDPVTTRWGRVPLASLDTAPPTAAELLASAEARKGRGELDSAVADLHAALALGLDDAEEGRRAYTLALALGAWELAPIAAGLAKGAAPPVEAETAAPPAPAVALAFGCAEADVSELTSWLPGPSLPLAEGEGLPEVAASTCLGPVISQTDCRPGDPPTWIHDELPEDERNAAIEEDLRVLEEERAAWEARVAAVELETRSLRAAWGPPRLRVELATRGAEGALLVIYQWTGQLSGYCGHVEEAGRTDVSTTRYALPGGLDLLQLWFEVPDEPVTWGAFVARDAAEAETFEAALRAPVALEGGGDGSPESWLRPPEPWGSRVGEAGVVGDLCAIMGCGC